MKKLWKKYSAIAAFVLCIVTIICIYAYKEYTRKLPDTQDLKATFNLKAANLLREFAIDELKATELYSDKVISVQGVVGSVETTDSSGTVFLNDGNSIASVMCQFDQKGLQQIQKLQEGDTINIKGVCSGYLMDLVMVRCILE